MVSTDAFHLLSAAGISLQLDLGVGHVHRLEITCGGRTIAPLHRAPWLDDPSMADDPTIAPNVRRLAGDFFCAPFGLNDVEPAPTHGWPANSAWRLTEERRLPTGGITAEFELERRVLGARVRKRLTLRDGHPFVYQQHTFDGGYGGITAAHHTMAHLPAGGTLSFSPKAYVDVPAVALETDPTRGRSMLRYPSRTHDLSAVPMADGKVADLHHYPFAERHEEFLMLVEARDSRLGWTAVLREHSCEAVLVLKHPDTLPVTLLWISNGGRDYPPWNGRHTGVIGIEDARCWSLFGHAASVADNPLARSGVPTSFDLGVEGGVAVRQVVGATPLPPTWRRIAAVETSESTLLLREASGAERSLPYDAAFLAGSSAG